MRNCHRPDRQEPRRHTAIRSGVPTQCGQIQGAVTLLRHVGTAGRPRRLTQAEYLAGPAEGEPFTPDQVPETPGTRLWPTRCGTAASSSAKGPAYAPTQ